MERILTVLIVLLLPLCGSARIFAQETGWKNISREIIGGRCVLESPDDPRVLYLGTTKGLYKTGDAGEHWNNILHDTDLAISEVVCDRADPRRLYAVTNKGIYAYSDSNDTWAIMYRRRDDESYALSAIIACSPYLYAATDQGLIVSNDNGARWNKESGVLGTNPVFSLAADPAPDGYVYAVTVDGAYRKMPREGAWRKIYSIPAGVIDEHDEESSDGPMRSVRADPAQRGTVYLAARASILVSRDSGMTWQSISHAGLPYRDVRALASDSQHRLYAATKTDVYAYARERWQRMTDGMHPRAINGLTAGAQRLYCTADAGLFATSELPVLSESDTQPVAQKQSMQDNALAAYTGGLPPIAAVQKAAIAYADVDMNKIDQWRRQARNKAMLPNVDIGINQDTSEFWHWEGGSTTKDNDDILRKGKNAYEWDLGLSWDLGELIWNDSQTSIDTRARLLVQLRADILDEVTKLYFEYVRVRMDMDSLTLLDKKKRVEKEVKLQELGAQLDGLTGNYFSAN